MNKNIIIILAVVAVVGGGAFIFFSKDAAAPQEQEQNTDNQQTEGETHAISYTDSGYSPSDITIQLGDTVVFENNSSTSAWPASNVHPIHSDYSDFDSRGPVAQGGSFSFTFERIGEWDYHDHLKPNMGGTITVE